MIKDKTWLNVGLLLVLLGISVVSFAQRPVSPIGDGPWYYRTYEEGMGIKVSVVTQDLFHPWSMVFLPGFSTDSRPVGDVLITEREGRIRLLRSGQLQAESVADLTDLQVDQLFDIVLHPDFAENGYIYITYMKKGTRPGGDGDYWATTAVARGTWDGNRITGLREIFAATDGWSENRGGDAIDAIFAPDGTLLIASSHRRDPDTPQSLGSHIGKVLRLTDDGGAPLDNPFIGMEGAKREIYSYGHRTIMGLTIHPETGEIWEAENGPQGGDEVNILRPGGNFGWPVVTYGREYDGGLASSRPWREDMIQPELFWVPSITLSSLTFYTGDKLSAWRNNLFVGAMTTGRLPGTGHIERIVFNEKGEIRREELLNDLHQRIRNIQQGPDGYLYLLTDENDGVLLKIEEATGIESIVLTGSEGAASSVGATEGPNLFPGSDCAACHQVERKTVGPSYKDIAREYENTPAVIDMLARKIIAGGEGNWGEVLMPAHNEINMAQARTMVERILNL